MTDKCDLTNAEVGDTLVLRCGGRIVVTSYDTDMIYHHNNGWTRDAGSYCDTETSELDVIAFEKKPHEPTPEEKAFKDGYEKGKRLGNVLALEQIAKQFTNNAMQARNSFNVKYGDQS